MKLLKDIVDAHIEAMGMVAENTMRTDQGYTIAYDEVAFLEVRQRLEANYAESISRRKTALTTAKRITRMLQGTMALEGQALDKKLLRELTKRTTRELLAKKPVSRRRTRGYS